MLLPRLKYAFDRESSVIGWLLLVCASARMLVCLIRNSLVLSSLVLSPLATCVQGSSPNIVHIFADDIGWGSVGFNNASTYIETPHLDSLAAGGMILDRSYSATVCSPSRASLLTGLHNGHAVNDSNAFTGAGLLEQDVTTGEIMQSAGYHTAVMGKWGWGASGSRSITPDPSVGWGNDGVPTLGADQAGDLPNNQGFDQFYGYLNHGAAHDFHYDWIWETNSSGNMVLTPNSAGPGGNPQYMQDLVNIESEQYIRDRAASGSPFYLQLNYTAVHFDIDAVQFTPELRNLDGQVVGAAGQGVYASNGSLTNKQKNYAATITRMDSAIGAIIDRLQDPNGDGLEDDSILDNTLIMFSSDNGATPEDGFGSTNVNSQAISGGLRGGKRDLYEGGIRAPAFAYWNGTIAAGTRSELLNDLADVQATAADLAGTLPRVGIDGVSLLPTLTGEGEQRPREGLLFENNANSQTGNPNTDWTIIVGDAKLVRLRNGSNQLYDLAADPDESSPLDLTANATLVADLEALALAEGAGKPQGYGMKYRDWIGSDGSNVNSSASWQVTSSGGSGGSPDETWSALLAGAASGNATARATTNVETLGIEVTGLNGNKQTLVVEVGASVSGRNEVRINDNGRVVLQAANLVSNRWVDVLPGGKLAGQGTVVGHLYNQGYVSPGQLADVGIVVPPPPPEDFTDSPATLLAFDYSGVQDNNGGATAIGTPLTNTSTLDPALTVVQGLQLGSGLNFRHPAGDNNPTTNAGDEYNINGFGQGSLSGAIASDDYLRFTVAPVNGLEMLLDEVSFDFWRNGTNAPSNYAVLTSIDGFTDSAALATFSILHAGQGGPNQTNPATLTASYNGGTWVTELDVRLYGWQTAGSPNASGNTHIVATELAGHFRLGGDTATPVLDLTGTLNLTGSYSQYDSGTLQVELGGTDNGDPLDPQFDQLIIDGQASLAGTLEVSLAGGFDPVIGNSFAVLTTTDGISGAFSTLVLPALDSGEAWQVLYDTNEVALLVILAGDFNADGIVDAADYSVWRDNLGSDVALPGETVTLGQVTQEDYQTWRLNFGATAAPLAGESAGVPEPSAVFLLGILATAFVVTCRRRSSRRYEVRS